MSLSKDELLNRLVHSVDYSEKNGLKTIEIPVEDVKMMIAAYGSVSTGSDIRGVFGQQLFYCIRCQASFWANGIIDEETKKRFCYTRWTSKCPRCGEQAEVNDHYWR